MKKFTTIPLSYISKLLTFPYLNNSNEKNYQSLYAGFYTTR